MAEQIAFGTIVKKGTTAIGNLVSVAFGGKKLDFVDTTHHGLSTPDKTTRPTLAEAQEWDLTLQCTSANLDVIRTACDPTAAASAYSITYPFGTPVVVTCNGWISEYSIDDAQPDGLLMVKCKIKPTGAITITGVP